MEKKYCISCKKEVTNKEAVGFECPVCGDTKIYRCGHCRTTCVRYSCLKCSFEGP